MFIPKENYDFFNFFLRTQSRDEIAGKLAIVEEQAHSSAQRLGQLEIDLSARENELNEARTALGTREVELELEKKSRQEAISAYESNERLLSENFERIKTENENLIAQNNLLQQELSKLGEQLIVLRNGNFKSI